MLRTLIALLFSIYSFGAIAQYDYDTDTAEYIEEAVTEEEEYDEESFSDEDTEQQYSFTTLQEQDTFTPAARMVSASTKDKFRNDSDFWYVEKGREKNVWEQLQCNGSEGTKIESRKKGERERKRERAKKLKRRRSIIVFAKKKLFVT